VLPEVTLRNTTRVTAATTAAAATSFIFFIATNTSSVLISLLFFIYAKVGHTKFGREYVRKLQRIFKPMKDPP
jgi:hypothetical protein